MTYGVEAASETSGRIRQDCEVLVAFFTEDELVSKYHGMGGFDRDEEISGKLEILNNIANLMDPSVPPEMAQTDLNAVQWSFDATKRGSPTVLHVLGLRRDGHRLSVDESVGWLQGVATAKRILSEISTPRNSDDLRVGANSLAAPHIRESKYIQNVQMGHRVRSKLARTTLEHLDSSRQLRKEQKLKVKESWKDTLNLRKLKFSKGKSS